MKQKEAEYADKYANADQQTIGNIKDNYERTEKGIVNELFFQVPHGGTIGNHREKIWGKMFENIVPLSLIHI